MSVLTEEALREIEARAEAATRGPWKPDVGIYGDPDGDEDLGYARTPMIKRERGEGYESFKARLAPNAAFLASARTDVPLLVKALREAWDERDAVRRSRWEGNTFIGVPEDEVASLRAQLAEVTAQAAVMREALEVGLSGDIDGDDGPDHHEFDAMVRAALAPDAGRALAARVSKLEMVLEAAHQWGLDRSSMAREASLWVAVEQARKDGDA